MNYQALQESIATAIKTNGEGEITGAVLQSVLQSMVSIVGANYQFMGVATTSTNPGTPAGSVFYLTSTAGTYTNFNNIEVEDGKLVALMWDSMAWSEAEIADLGGGGGNVDYDVISGANVQLKDENATSIYPKTNVEMVDGFGNKTISPTTTTIINRVYQGSQNGVVGGTFSYSVISSGVSYYQSQKFSIIAGNKYHFKWYANSLCYSWAFLDASDKILTIASAVTGKTLVDIDMVAPEGAVTLIVTRYKQTADPDAVLTQLGIFPVVEGNISTLQDEMAIEREGHVYVEPLGVLDNLFAEGSMQAVNETTKAIPSNIKRKSDGKVWALRQPINLRYQNLYDINTFAVVKIKKTGIAGRTYVISNYNVAEGGNFSTSITFKEDVQEGYIIRNTYVMMAKVLRVTDEYIWLFLPCYEYQTNTSQYTHKEHVLYACDSFTSTTNYTAGELVYDSYYTFCLEGEYKVDEDIESLINIDRKYYTRAEKLGSQLAGKNVFVFSDSLSFFFNALVYDWGANVYSNAWGGARMGYEGGGGQGGESETYEDAWLCRDSYVQYVKANVISAGVGIDYIVCTAGVNGTLPDTDATEVQYVADNKRWYHDSLESDPWASLSSANKARFTGTACTYVAFYSLCRAYPKAIPVIVTPYRTPGAGNYSTLANWTSAKFATYLFNGNLKAKAEKLREMSENLGGILVDCYNATRDSIANIPQYHPTDGVHPTRIVANDMGNLIGRALSNEHGLIVEDVTYN